MEKFGRAATLEIFGTGLWLALMQVSLGFALLCGAGATILFYFLLIAIWIAGSAFGVLARGRISSMVCFLLAMALAIAAHVSLAMQPFGGAGFLICLASGLLCGFYAGLFFRERIAGLNNVRLVLLHENNGFMAGYVVATLFLFVSVTALHVVAIVLAAALVGLRFRTSRI